MEWLASRGDVLTSKKHGQRTVPNGISSMVTWGLWRGQELKNVGEWAGATERQCTQRTMEGRKGKQEVNRRERKLHSDPQIPQKEGNLFYQARVHPRQYDNTESGKDVLKHVILILCTTAQMDGSCL